MIESTPAVRPATSADRARAAQVLAAAFADDPLFLHVLPLGARRRAERLRRFFDLEVQRSERTGGTWAAADGAGTAVWFPPGTWRPTAREVLREAPAVVRVLGREAPRALRVQAALQRHHPSAPHWYLLALATEPGRQGGGVGTALLRPVLERCDRDRVPAYLEATTERSRRLYLRHGFRDAEPLHLPGGPPVHPMWRDPR
ncbi:GNAT family N-acetyltransferase [Pseudonocardia broussonetiae]|uniref:GNAT family N-acetyltransferase n=1 Tax=Pseudonocardia broussonetiae TaxID=2736640 RepID=A0A6M6JED4_9PSEU|nr:GNAT family N-acetyltransferase [Pseudonocardia broussonetiae]QJY45463.1 GNAT family N-acetyltransferase [Pseudonocardia broussonetiae]